MVAPWVLSRARAGVCVSVKVSERGEMGSSRWLRVAWALWMTACGMMRGVTALPLYRQPLSCSSWRFNFEVNNLRGFRMPGGCESYVEAYMMGSAYQNDSADAMEEATKYARSVAESSSFNASARYAWVLDIDDTCLSTAPYYADYHFGIEAYNQTLITAWMEKAEAPTLPATLQLFDALKDLQYFVFLLTGRVESLRNATISNLINVGYSGWEALILRQYEDVNVSAILYKSAKRKSLEDLGYTIIGNVGDQWSDLSGYSIGDRVFKLPNPMYYVP